MQILPSPTPTRRHWPRSVIVWTASLSLLNWRRRARSLWVVDINIRLDRRYRLLTGGDRSAFPRQQTLRALVDWSYDLLDAPQKALLCRLSVFARGWTLPAAAAVCAAATPNDAGYAGLEEWEVLDALTSLVDKSLVKVTDEETTRYGMLETIHQYAVEKLAEVVEAEAARSRHRDWYLALAEAAELPLRGPDQTQWLIRLATEHDNLRAALAWSVRDAHGAEAGLRLAGALWRFWWIRGYQTEGREHLAKTLGQPSVAGTAAAAKALYGSGILAWSQGDYAAARALQEQSIAAFERLDDRRGVAAALLNLGLVAWNQTDVTQAQASLEQCLGIFRELGDRRGIGLALDSLGNVALEQGDFPAARALYEESLMICRALGDQQSIARTLCNLSSVAIEQADYATAQGLLAESLPIRHELGDKPGIALALANLATMALEQRLLGEARRQYEECILLCQELGDKRIAAECLHDLASIFAYESKLELAVVLIGAANALRESIGSSPTLREQVKYDRQFGQVRSDLGDAAYDAAMNKGRSLTLSEAVGLALQKTPQR